MAHAEKEDKTWVGPVDIDILLKVEGGPKKEGLKRFSHKAVDRSTDIPNHVHVVISTTIQVHSQPAWHEDTTNLLYHDKITTSNKNGEVFGSNVNIS